MKSILGYFLILLLIFVFLIPAKIMADESPDYGTLVEFYRDFIIFSIENGKYNTELRYSKSDEIRRAATISCLRNSYISYHKDELVREMIERNIGTRVYKIRAFLKQNFISYAESKGLNLDATSPFTALPPQPPIRFETMSVRQFCRNFCLPIKAVKVRLKKKDFIEADNEFSPKLRFKQIASNNNLSPGKIYKALIQ